MNLYPQIIQSTVDKNCLVIAEIDSRMRLGCNHVLSQILSQTEISKPTQIVYFLPDPEKFTLIISIRYEDSDPDDELRECAAKVSHEFQIKKAEYELECEGSAHSLEQ